VEIIMSYRTVTTLCLTLTLGGPGVAAGQVESLYHEAFRKLHEAGQFNGAVLISKGDTVLLDAYFGDADKLDGTRLTANSLYRLASVSKTLTSAAVLSLVDARKLSLDDPVQKFLPTFPYSDITVRHLLQHSSGLPEYIFGVGDYWKDRTAMMTNRDVLQWLVETKPELAFTPGQSWDYSNTGYALLPLLIEAVTKERYAAYLRRAVFAPAGMRSSYHISELGPAERARVARGHGFDYGAGVDVRVDRHPVFSADFKADSIYGAGDVFSTARDLLAFDRALKAGKVISPALQAAAYISLMLPEGFPAGYGLGWQVAESDFTGRIIHHHGQGDGYRTRYYRFLDRGITIVILQNARERYADEAVRIAQQLAFKGAYTLPAASLAEAVSRTMVDKGVEAALSQVAEVAKAPGQWSVVKRDLDNVALTHWFRGDRPLAIRFFRSYLALAPDDPRPYATLAEALGDVGRAEESKAEYSKALDVANKDPRRWAREITQIRKAMGHRDDVDDFLRALMREREIPGMQVAVVQHGRIVKSGSYGLANLQDSVPVDDRTLFAINSMTKVFTGVAVMQLIEEGKLRLADKASTFLPDLPAGWGDVTIGQMLSHTSGLPNVMNNNTGRLVGGDSEAEAWAWVQRQPMEFAPNERFSYNQTNYLLLGRIIALQAGMPFTDYIVKRQLAVVGMPRTMQGGFAHYDEVVPHSARGYSTINSDKVVGVYESFPPSLRTAAGMSTTALELARWLIALQDGRLFAKPGSLAQLWAPAVLANGRSGGFGGVFDGYAMGWPTIGRSAHPAVGAIGGGRVAMFVYPQDDLAIVVLTNLQGGFPERVMDRLASFYVPGMSSANVTGPATPARKDP
jgi:CubicO group peptidase (beta-lactamase class C family)